MGTDKKIIVRSYDQHSCALYWLHFWEAYRTKYLTNAMWPMRMPWPLPPAAWKITKCIIYRDFAGDRDNSNLGDNISLGILQQLASAMCFFCGLPSREYLCLEGGYREVRLFLTWHCY